MGEDKMPFVAAQTATDHDDLLDKLITFLTVTITPSNQRWIVLKDVINPDTGIYTDQIGTTREVYLRGPGISATETTITSVTDNATIARFNFTGPTLEIGQEVVIKDFTVNTDYNGVYFITATDGTTYFETGVLFGSNETGAFYTGADSINIQIRRHSITAVAGTAANWELQASTSFLDINDFREQPGSAYLSDSTNQSYATLSDEPFTYWFVGNGRYFWVATSISTVTPLFGGGFYLPYALPSELPFPMFIAGNAGNQGIRWSIGTETNYNFFGQDIPGTFPWINTNIAMYVRNIDGFWLNTYCDISPSFGDTTAALQPCDRNDARDFIDTLDGSYVLLPYTIFTGYSDGNVYGELDGVYWTTFFNIAALDTIQINSTDYLVLQNMWDSTTNIDFAALRLE
jgi:hypothetical protein